MNKTEKKEVMERAAIKNRFEAAFNKKWKSTTQSKNFRETGGS